MSMNRKLPPDFEIIKRRVGEEKREKLEHSRKMNEKWKNQASWENKSHSATVKQREQLKVEQYRAAALQNLYERKKKLSQLLEQERKMYEMEFHNSFETADERREKLRKRAQELKDNREARRREFAQQMIKQQQRLAQDEMRLEQSRLRTQKVAVDRRSQLVEKQKLQEQQRANDQEFARVWEENRLEKYKRERSEAAAALERNSKTREMLDQQVLYNRVKQEREAAAIEEERTKWRAKWAEEENMDIEMNIKRLEEQRKARYATQKDNLDRARQRALEKSEENALDLHLLRLQQEKDAAAEAAEQAERDRVRRAQREFQEHLVEMAKKEKRDESYLERVRQEEQEKVWKKREDRWRAEDEDRQALMREVDRTRQIQIKERELQRQAEEKASAEWAAKAKEFAKEADEQERQRQSAVKHKRDANRDFILKQIEDKKFQQAVEKQRAMLEEKRAQKYHQNFEQEIREMRKELQENGIGLENFPRRTGTWW